MIKSLSLSKKLVQTSLSIKITYIHSQDIQAINLIMKQLTKKY